MGSARDDVLALLAAARADGFAVADDGVVTGGGASTAAGHVGRRQHAGDRRRAHHAGRCRPRPVGGSRCRHRTRHHRGAEPARTHRGHRTAPAGAWPVPLADVVAGWSAIGQDRIANQIAAMTPEQRQRLIDEFPKQVGNTDGVPWDMRDRGEPDQHRAGDRRRTTRAHGAGIAGPRRVLPGSACGGRRPRAQRPPGGSPDPRVRPRPGVADRAQREPGHRQEASPSWSPG